VAGQRPVEGLAYQKSANRYSHERRIRKSLKETSTQNLSHPSGRMRGKGLGAVDILFIGKLGISLTRVLCKSES
jgi:hypothetical protein